MHPVSETTCSCFCGRSCIPFICFHTFYRRTHIFQSPYLQKHLEKILRISLGSRHCPYARTTEASVGSKAAFCSTRYSCRSDFGALVTHMYKTVPVNFSETVVRDAWGLRSKHPTSCLRCFLRRQDSFCHTKLEAEIK